MPLAVTLAFEATTKNRPPDEQYVGIADFRLYLCNLKWYSSTTMPAEFNRSISSSTLSLPR